MPTNYAKISISVIIPTFNRSALLMRAINSVQKQKYAPQECIVIDDGSMDDTEAIVVTAQNQNPSLPLRYLRTENLGVSHARNLGISIACGTWLAFLDSDDEWLPDKLELQAAFIDACRQIKIVHGEEIWIRNHVRVNAKKKHAKAGGWIYQRCLPLCCISPSAVMVAKSVFSTIGGFDETFPVCEDYDFWLRASCRYEVGFVATPIIKKFGGHADQLSKKFIAMDYWRVKAMLQMLEANVLCPADAQATRVEIKRKAAILLKGYEKHGNLKAHQEIATWHAAID